LISKEELINYLDEGIMKLGVGFHIFSGLELLKPAILNIRNKADFVLGIYSLVSYMGHPCPSYMMDLLSDLLKDNLLDDVILYEPKITNVPLELAGNHRVKREMGRLCCLEKECTHYMSRDCDEFFNKEQLEKQWETIKQFEFTGAATVDYVGSPLTKMKKVSSYHEPVIHDIRLKYEPFKFGPLFDLSRTVATASTIKIFAPDELLIHHLSGVRINDDELKRKWQGHSCYKTNPVDKWVNSIKNHPQEELEKVEDQFDVLSYWNGEFQKYLGK
jgi:hypothetical protein